MKPLILITNDDGYEAKGLRTLYTIAQEFGDVVVMATEQNASCKSLSLTPTRPLRVRNVREDEHLSVYASDGTPGDCVKLAVEHFCPRRPSIVLSGINHGSNSSINVLYSGTLGAVLEATTLGFPAAGFSLLSHNPDADFSHCIAPVRHIIASVLNDGLPEGVALNVNIPKCPEGGIKGIRVCHQAKARWTQSFEKRTDPQGRPYWWLTGRFVCNDPPETSDEWALAHGYISVVPIQPDYTCHEAIGKLLNLNT